MDDQRLRADPFGWVINVLLVIAAVALVAYGVYMIVVNKSRQIGPFLVGLGLIFIPVPVISMLGALIALGAGVYCFTVGATLNGIVFALVGLVTLADRGRGFGRRG